MRTRLFIFMLLVALPTMVFGQSTSRSYSFGDKGASSTITDGTGGTNVGYVRVIADAGSTTPSGVAIFGYKPAGVLVSEAGVPASPLIRNGRIYAEVSPTAGRGTDIGLAIANPGTASATISFNFTRTDGTDFGGGTLTLAPGEQKARFLDEDPYNSGLGVQGTFSFTSNVPVSVVALQGFRNERGDFLITTLPVINTDVAPGAAAALLPYYTDGDGWTTSILLVNPTDTPMTGTIGFRGTGGAAQSLTANGQSAGSFSYTVARRSSFKLQTAGAGSLQTGSVTVTPSSGSNAPVPLVVFSFAAGGATITQAGVPANLATTFRMYVEATTGYGSVGSYSSGFAIANAAAGAATVTAELFSPSGASVASTTVPVPGNGVNAKFIQEVFPNVALPFQGILRLTTNTSGISVVGLRIRFNERNEFLMTTTPPTNEASTPSAAEYDFPQIVNGGGFTTQFNLFSGTAGQSASGTLRFVKTDGTALGLNINSMISTPAPVLTSVSPSRVAVGGSLTLTGSNFNASASSNTVVFTGASGTVNATPGTGSATSLTVTVPSGAITGPVLVRNGDQSSSSKIVEITAAGGTQIQTSITVGAGATASGADIYVPPPASGLILTDIGIGVPFTSIFSFPATAEINRGDTKQLRLAGTGFTSGTTVSFSGGGITVTDLAFQTSLFVTIRVDAAAATGFRNVIVTNANGDTSIMAGGLSIK